MAYSGPIEPAISDDDLSLVSRAQQGERAALDSLLRRHYDRIHAVCRRIAGNEADADDATQEALIAIVRGLDRFGASSSFGTWAYRVAVNSTLDELRRRRRRPEPAELPETGEPSGLTAPSLDTLVADRLDIDAALAKLPLTYRTVVVLRDVSGLEYSEIAEVLEIPVGTVRSRISRGRAALVPLLGPPSGNSSPSADRPS